MLAKELVVGLARDFPELQRQLAGTHQKRSAQRECSACGAARCGLCGEMWHATVWRSWNRRRWAGLQGGPRAGVGEGMALQGILSQFCDLHPDNVRASVR
eukprot:COSAG01_NODE_10853_length_2068_cov_2.018283_2_plen_100_part_00